LVQREILEKHPKAQIQVYAVWFNMLPSDSRETWPDAVLSDPRVTHFWDEERLVGKWFGQSDQLGKSATLGGISWDIYFLYGPEARWEETPQPLRSYGRPIVYTNIIEEVLPLIIEK